MSTDLLGPVCDHGALSQSDERRRYRVQRFLNLQDYSEGAKAAVSSVSKATNAVVSVADAATFAVGMPVTLEGFTDMTQMNCQAANVTLALGGPEY